VVSEVAERVVDAWQICVVTNENGVARPEIRFVAKQDAPRRGRIGRIDAGGSRLERLAQLQSSAEPVEQAQRCAECFCMATC
jgi:hypothetical protein